MLTPRGFGQDIPYARGWVPILGHLLKAGKYMKDNNQLATARMMMAIKEEEGHDIFNMDLMGMTLTCLTDVEAVEELITNDPERFTKNLDAFPKPIVNIWDKIF